MRRRPETGWGATSISGINRHCAVQEWAQPDLEPVVRGSDDAKGSIQTINKE
ncbi:MAG: hypothetical protein MRK00_04050 [Nitrosomonas sp.]|nr:hypothetical protein [Nitrosomonas sp.]